MRLGPSTDTDRRTLRGDSGVFGKLPGALLVVAWLACLAPAAAAPVASEERVAVRRVTGHAIPGFPLRDEAAMVLVGSALIGLAAAVRRAA